MEAVLNAIYIGPQFIEQIGEAFVDTFLHNREIWRRLEAKEITHGLVEERLSMVARGEVEMSNELSNAITRVP
jgi:hypothetical protein